MKINIKDILIVAYVMIMACCLSWIIIQVFIKGG